MELSQYSISWIWRPVAKLARAGTQIGQLVYASTKRVPRAASASRLGVLASGWPAQPIIEALCSSDIKMSRFCGRKAGLPGVLPRAFDWLAGSDCRDSARGGQSGIPTKIHDGHS